MVAEHVSNKFDDDFDDKCMSANVAANNKTIHNDTNNTGNNMSEIIPTYLKLRMKRILKKRMLPMLSQMSMRVQ